MILRVLNPSDSELDVSVFVGLPFGEVVSVRLDETPDGRPSARDGSKLTCAVGPHQLRSLRLGPQR